MGYNSNTTFDEAFNIAKKDIALNIFNSGPIAELAKEVKKLKSRENRTEKKLKDALERIEILEARLQPVNRLEAIE